LRIITLIDNICGSASPPSRLVKMLNRPDRQFMAEQGLSVIIEMENGQRVLFDTGSSEQVFLHNLRLLGLDRRTSMRWSSHMAITTMSAVWCQ